MMLQQINIYFAELFQLPQFTIFFLLDVWSFKYE